MFKSTSRGLLRRYLLRPAPRLLTSEHGARDYSVALPPPPPVQPIQCAVTHTAHTDLGKPIDSSDVDNDGVHDNEFEGNLEAFAAEIRSKPKVVIQFCAEWCGACAVISPMVKQLHQEYAKRGVDYIYVDVDECSEVTKKYHVTKIPCFIFFQNGTEVQRVEGSELKEPLELFANRMF